MRYFWYHIRMVIHPLDNVEIHEDGHKYARRDIAAGEHVHVHNLATNLGDVLEYRYEPEFVDVQHVPAPEIMAYRHSDGRVEYNPRRALWTPRDFPQVSGYFSSIEECMAVAKELNALFPHLDALPNWSCMDIVPRGRGKAVGVREIAEYFGVDYEHTFVVGDNYNDLPMIDVFRSYIVSSACDEVKTHAREGVVDSVEKMIGIIGAEQ